jgi:hypothetical protein
VLVASHVALFRLFSRTPLSFALAVSIVTVVVLKYVW